MGGPVVNKAPSATLAIMAERHVTNEWHSTRYYGQAGTPDLVSWLEGFTARIVEAGGEVAEGDTERRDVLRAIWQFANGWLKDARDGRGARHPGARGSIADGDQWSRTARFHADVTTCTGGRGAPHQTTSWALADVPGHARCGSDICAPAYARADEAAGVKA